MDAKGRKQSREAKDATRRELKEKFEKQEEKIKHLEKTLEELCQSPILIKKKYVAVEAYCRSEYQYHKPRSRSKPSATENGCSAFCSSVVAVDNKDKEDDNVEQFSKKIADLKKTYSKQFTVHGLSRVFMGRKLERLVWGLFLLAAFAFSGYLLYSLYSRFMKREVYTKVEFVHEKKIKLPTISLCSRQYLQLCSVYPVLPQKLCVQKYKNLFKVKKCRLGDLTAHSANCTDPKYWKNDEGCLLINPEGNLAQTSPGIDFGLTLEVSFNTSSDVQMRIHDSEEPSEDEAYGQYRIIGSTYLDLQMNVERIKRLSAPFHSNCTNGTNLEHFYNTEGYSVVSCRRVCRLFKLLETCGIVFPQSFRGVPKSVVAKYKVHIDNPTPQNKKLAYLKWRQCVLKVLPKSFESSGKCNCPPACNEIRYTYIPRDDSSVALKAMNNTIKMNVYFNTMQYTVWEEVPAYSLEQMIAEFGGLLGLLIGASVLSLLEVLVYCGLSLSQSLYKFLYA